MQTTKILREKKRVREEVRYRDHSSKHWSLPGTLGCGGRCCRGSVAADRNGRRGRGSPPSPPPPSPPRGNRTRDTRSNTRQVLGREWTVVDTYDIMIFYSFVNNQGSYLKGFLRIGLYLDDLDGNTCNFSGMRPPLGRPHDCKLPEMRPLLGRPYLCLIIQYPPQHSPSKQECKPWGGRNNTFLLFF